MNVSLALSRPFRTAAIDAAARKQLFLALFVTVVAATLSPLLWVRVPPLVDYPNHLARMWILVHSNEIPELASNYTVHWRILPDLAIDLVVSLLSWVMPVEQAGRVFIALTMLSLVGGTLTLHRVLHGRLETWPIWSILFVYNAALFWGFVNCLFATGIYLFAFSGWIATRHWRTGPRLLTFSAVASLLLLLHFSPSASTAYRLLRTNWRDRPTSVGRLSGASLGGARSAFSSCRVSCSGTPA